MGELLLGGSAAAAFLAGTVAFFAPCCSAVMLPSYLASAAGAHRWRAARLTALFVAGVATVVWPLTIGAAGLASLFSRYHTELFIVGGTMMLVIGVLTLRGWMWSLPMPQARLGTDAASASSVYLIGVFAGAATACCAPVLAGAVAISGVSGDWWVGAVMGGIYLLGLITPLLIASVAVERLRKRLHDPAITLRLAGRTLHTTRMRLVTGITFILLGAFIAALALTGQADTAPGAQQALGRWLSERATWLAEHTPFAVGWALLAAFVAALALLALRSRAHDLKEESR